MAYEAHFQRLSEIQFLLDEANKQNDPDGVAAKLIKDRALKDVPFLMGFIHTLLRQVKDDQTTYFGADKVAEG